jgi:putative transcriptional regulator
MTDPNFAHSVVLLLQHENQGAFGLVLNRPTGTTVKEVWSQAAQGTCVVDDHVYLGGPVPGPLLALHDREGDGDDTPLEGLFVTAEPEALARLLADPPARLRLFAGYSGWGEGQLERELQDAAWVTTPAALADAFCPSGEPAWRAVLVRATGSAQDPLGQSPAPPGPRPDSN